MWKYELWTADPPSYTSSDITLYELNAFARKCDPKATVDETNAELWILKFLMEENEYKAEDIKAINIKLVEIITAATANY